MALPTYDKSKRRVSFEALPKGCYVIEIKAAKEEQNRNGSGSHLTIYFDIAEGDFRGFYANQYQKNTREDKKWSNDAAYYLNIPTDSSPQYVWDSYNTFFADLEDSNSGFVFTGEDLATLKGKKLGGKFAIEQTQYNGRIYNHTRLRWTCVADDVRSGKASHNMPNDKLIQAAVSAPTDSDGFSHPLDDEELPFS